MSFKSLWYSLILLIPLLSACPGGSGGGSSTGTAVASEPATWPPKTETELLGYLDGRSFKSTSTDDTLSFSSGTLSFVGPTSTFHTATIFTSTTANYQTPYNCSYTANEMTTFDFNGTYFQLKFNVLNSNDFEPGGIEHCVRPNCSSCERLESVNFSFTASTGCFNYDGQIFCKQ